MLPGQAVAAADAVEKAVLPEQAVEPAERLGDIAAVPDDGRPFTLRLGCYNTAQSASAAASIYASRKLAPFVAHVILQQGRWWIFYTGSFASRDEAECARTHIDLPEADIIFMPYACRVGVFNSADMDEGLISGMQKLGCEPYVLDNGDGTVSLFAGVYRQRDNAEELRRVLAENNIDSTVVLLSAGASDPSDVRPEGGSAPVAAQ
jgi:SPOR domain